MPYVWVDVDLSEFDTDELLDELHSRRVADGGSVSVAQIYDAMHAGKEREALRLMREYLQDATGRIV